MRDIHLQIKIGLQKGRLFDDFMKKDEHGKADMGFTDEDLHYLTHVNNFLHSFFSNCKVYLNNQQVYPNGKPKWSLWTQGFNFQGI